MLEPSAVRAVRSHRDLTAHSPSKGFLRAMTMTLDRALEALADPTRRKLIETLASGPQSAGALARPFEISRPAVSRHLRVLRDAGLVEVESEGGAIRILGDSWRKADFPYSVTENTILEFDFRSDFEGDLHGIGLVRGQAAGVSVVGRIT